MVKGAATFSNKVLVFEPLTPCLIAPDEVFKLLSRESVPTIREYYLVSNYGRVFNRFTCQFLVPQMGTDGYYALALSTDNGGKMFRINRLVMLTFCPIPNPESMVVNHLDCNPLNNHISNLEWTTRTGNAIHAYDNNLMKYGENGPTAIISKETAIKIAELLQTNMTYKQIAATVGNGATIGIVQNIHQGHGWVRDLKDYSSKFREVKPKKPKCFRITKDMVHDLCKYFVSTPQSPIQNNRDYCKGALEYYNYFGFDLSKISTDIVGTVVNIYKRRIHTDVTSQYNY